MKLNSNLMDALGIASLPEAEQAAILEKVNRRLEDVMMRVLVENLSENEVKEMRDILKKGEGIEDRVAKIASGVPRLAEKVEYAVTEEIDRLRAVLKE